jgi:ribonucleoside-diphosphate reductase alpha chain
MNDEGCSYGLEPYFSLEPIQVRNSFGIFEKQDKIVGFLEGKTKHIECANDLDWKAHVNILEAYYTANKPGIVQGASKTLNFKKNVTVENIKESIIYCWQHNIKAISFYRDGSRKDQVLTAKSDLKKDNEGNPIEIVESFSPKRPVSLSCEIYRAQCERKKWLVFVSTLDGKPFEVFAGLESKISIPKKFKNGNIVRVITNSSENGKTKKRYDLIVGEGEDQLIVSDIPTMFENIQYASLTRMISMSLRHGAPVKCVVEQLSKDGNLDAFQKVVARTLKGYIPENESTHMKCEKCGSEMVYMSGCPTCQCGYSKCG